MSIKKRVVTLMYVYVVKFYLQAVRIIWASIWE